MGVLRISSDVRDAGTDEHDQAVKATATSNDVDREGLWGSLPRDVNDAMLGAVDVSRLQASCCGGREWGRGRIDSLMCVCQCCSIKIICEDVRRLR